MLTLSLSRVNIVLFPSSCCLLYGKSGYSGAPTSGGRGMCIRAGEPHFQTLLFAIRGREKIAQ